MATIFLFLLLSEIFTAKAQPGQSNIEPGSYITATVRIWERSIFINWIRKFHYDCLYTKQRL